ncbi:MAG: JAB domain-containing protein [Sedimenticolaceae bacterium]
MAPNGAAVFLTHNHPSKDAAPREADQRITARLRSALEFNDIRLIDHIVVVSEETASFAEQALV